MDRGIITISETGKVFMPAVPVWMTLIEIADLFGVFFSDVRRAVRSIYKNRESVEQDTMRYIKNDDRTSMDAYSLEVVIGVAFKLRSREILFFRRYLISSLCLGGKEPGCLLFYIHGNRERNGIFGNLC